MYRRCRRCDVHLRTVRARELGLPWIMTTLQMAIPTAEALDTPEAQEARWIAWKVKGAAADRITERRVRIAFAALLITLAGATLATVL